MANIKQIPLTCSGHTRPVVHLDFSDVTECGYFLISACKGNIEKPHLYPYIKCNKIEMPTISLNLDINFHISKKAKI